MPIDVTTLAERLGKGDALLLVDVRAPHEFQKYRIAGAINLPLHSLKARPTAVPLHGRTIVTLCTKGGGRSPDAADALRAAGATDVTFLEGGTKAWQAAGQAMDEGPWPEEDD